MVILVALFDPCLSSLSVTPFSKAIFSYSLTDYYTSAGCDSQIGFSLIPAWALSVAAFMKAIFSHFLARHYTSAEGVTAK